MKAYEIVFSPTGGTQKVAEAPGATLPAERLQVDLLTGSWTLTNFPWRGDGVAVIAVPPHGGRVPEVALQRPSCQVDGTRAVLVCVYGNRAYEDTLVELRIPPGRPVYGGGRGGRGGGTPIARQFAAGRPDDLTAQPGNLPGRFGKTLLRGPVPARPARQSAL